MGTGWICPCDINLDTPGTRDYWLRNRLHQISLWLRLSGAFSSLPIDRVGPSPLWAGAIPKYVGFLYIRKVLEQAMRNKLASSVPLWALVQFLSWVPTLASPADGLQPVSQIKTLSSQGTFGHGVHQPQDRANWGAVEWLFLIFPFPFQTVIYSAGSLKHLEQCLSRKHMEMMEKNKIKAGMLAQATEGKGSPQPCLGATPGGFFSKGYGVNL